MKKLGTGDAEGATEARKAVAGEVLALVKSSGISVLTTGGGSELLKAAMDDRKAPGPCEGAILTLSALCGGVPQITEGIIIALLPAVFECFNDRAKPVREATTELAEAIMKMVSPLAVKTILPPVFKGLEHKDWQVKEGCLKCLKWLAEAQRDAVGACLVDIVPAVSACLSDTKKQVSKAAREAMSQACLVISNPDILPLVPDVIKTIGDISKTEKTMDKLLATTFVTQIDQPTLAIMVPILSRSLTDRRQLMKRKAALVIDNMCKLVAEPMDMAPFGPILEPKLTRNAEEIASEEIREFCQRALTTLRNAMGEAADTVVPPPAMTTADMLTILTEVIPAEVAASAGPLLEHSVLMCHFKLASERRLEEDVTAAAVKPYLSTIMAADAAETATASFQEKCATIIAAAAKDEGYVMQEDDLCHIEFSLAYGGKVLLQNSKLHLKKGHRYGLIGANGVGKTTLMRAIANNQLEEFPNDILRTIFVEHDLDDGENDEISVTDWIKKTKIIRDENTDEQIDEALDRMGFFERKSQSIGSLSGGWKMKLALSRAM